MRQLGILDSAFINLENPNTPQHVGGLGIYDPSTAPNGIVRFKEVIANFEQRLKAMPQFRTRLAHVPGKIDRPYWVTDENFDVEFHLRHVALPKPGDWRQLWIQAARLHARSLDMTRPLWEAYIIEGLDNIEDVPPGSFAIYTKMHHSLVDGAGGEAFMTALHDLTPIAEPRVLDNKPILVDRNPSAGELLVRSASNRIKQPISLAKGAAQFLGDYRKHAKAVKNGEIPSADVEAPRTRFNESVGPHRVAQAAVFQLDDFKLIKNACNATINDVALSVIGGAMRKYLELHNELPEESLAAGIPLNMRGRRADSEDDNNQVGSMTCHIHTNIADPLERLAAVSRSASDAKLSNEANPAIDALKIAGVFSPAVTQWVSKAWAKNDLSRLVPANMCTVISNTPGPNYPLYSAGAKMVRYHSMGLLTPGCASFHLVFSVNGLITVTFLADRNAIPDPEVYLRCLEESYAETLQAAKALQTGAVPAKKKAVPAKKKVAAKKATGAAAKAKAKNSSKPKKAVANKAAGKGTSKK